MKQKLLSCVCYSPWFHWDFREHVMERALEGHSTQSLLSWATVPCKPTWELIKLHHKTHQAAACHPLLLLKAVPELPSSAGCKPSSFQTEFITWNPSRLTFWTHDFNPAWGGSRGWRGFFAFLLLHKPGRTFPWSGEPTAWMKGGAQLSVPAFPPLFAGNSLHYWALCYPIAAFPSQITYFFCRQSCFLIARFISGQLAARRHYLCQFVQNPRFPTGSSLTRGSPGQTWTWLSAVSSSVRRKVRSLCLIPPECVMTL